MGSPYMKCAEYSEEDYLQLSGIQHFAFCHRQWALIHIEELWAENERTVGGEQLHERAHDAALSELRGDVLTVRAMPVRSRELGVNGVCDVVEFIRDAAGVPLTGRKGTFRPYPVEYKHGQAKLDDCDRLQLCAQAMCLEEMLAVPVPAGALYYGETRRRELVPLDAELRTQVRDYVEEMHADMRRHYTPKPKRGKYCNACSLKEQCLPVLERRRSAAAYLREMAEEGAP